MWCIQNKIAKVRQAPEDQVDSSMRSLECRRLHLSRRNGSGLERNVLTNINAAFPGGSISLILGATGAGKSTLLHLLGGLLRPTQGEVLADGQPVSRWITSHRDLWRRQVGIVFQNPHFLDDLTVLENVILPMVPRRLPIAALRKQGLEILANLDLRHLAGHDVLHLSGGELQRVALARSLLAKPRFILADEPTAHQDNLSAELVLRTLQHAKNHNTVVVIAAHDPRVVQAGLADSTWALQAGQLRQLS